MAIGKIVYDLLEVKFKLQVSYYNCKLQKKKWIPTKLKI